ncbi:hypothetical protein, partial [Streptosporangium sp. NPDC048865]|uniref:hypothetical protein n=1 Tax=Streptosporangium sp. NPDC048865 TaxID=3155766 RepID=UPI00341E798A
LSIALIFQRLGFTTALPQLVPKEYMGHAAGVVGVTDGRDHGPPHRGRHDRRVVARDHRQALDGPPRRGRHDQASDGPPRRR